MIPVSVCCNNSLLRCVKSALHNGNTGEAPPLGELRVLWGSHVRNSVPSMTRTCNVVGMWEAMSHSGGAVQFSLTNIIVNIHAVSVSA